MTQWRSAPGGKLSLKGLWACCDEADALTGLELLGYGDDVGL